jgi:hypothetical protein
MKGFYNLPKLVQWIIALIMMVAGIVMCLPLVLKPYGLIVVPLLAPILNLASVPFFRLIGYYKYLNPYVLSIVQNDKEYDLHNIFTFDYLINFTWQDRGAHAQKVLLAHYIKALLTIIERIESKKLSPAVKIVGCSYFFNTRTAEKFGFTLSDASIFWKINSILQFIELSYLYSFAKGKWAMPKFWQVKRAEIIGSDLAAKKETLEKWVQRLEA